MADFVKKKLGLKKKIEIIMIKIIKYFVEI